MTLIESQSYADLKTAIQWVLVGHERGREFVPLISERYRMRYDAAELLQDAGAYIRALASSETQPSALTFFEVPKKKYGEMRQVPALSLLDKIALSWATIRSWRVLHDTIKWAQTPSLPPVDHQHSLPADPTDMEWIENFLPSYRSFIRRDDTAHKAGHWVLNLDVRDFSANASLAKTASILSERGAAPAAVAVFNAYAQAWPNTGVPMGLAFTDALLKLFMTGVDTALFKEFGHNYFRYVDDLRIVCSSEDGAKEALRKASDVLAANGLSLNEKKTFIQNPAEPTRRMLQQQTLNRAAFSVHSDPTHYDWANDVFNDWVLPRLKSGETRGNDFYTVYKKTLYSLGDRKFVGLVPHASTLLTQYPEGGKFLMVYLDRANAGPRARHTLMHALTMKNSGDTHHYETFRHASRLRMTYGLNARGLLPLLDDAPRPYYQHLFLDDAKRTLACTPVMHNHPYVTL